MKLKVVGKSHFSGTSQKTGRPYDFIQIHYLSPADRVEGLAAVSGTMDPQLCDYAAIKVDAYYNIEYNRDGRIISFSAA